MSLDEQIPIHNLPTVSGQYKIVQLDIDGNAHLLFAERRSEIHAGIIMTFAY